MSSTARCLYHRVVGWNECYEKHHQREPPTNEITPIELDLSKHVFQVHGADASGVTVVHKRLRRSEVLAFFTRPPRCLVGLEAYATAHYWARELQAIGHEVRLMPAQYVKAYVKRNKNDAADAQAARRCNDRQCGLCRSRQPSNKQRCFYTTVAGRDWCASAPLW